MAHEERHFQPVDTINETIKTAGILGGAGFAISSVQNALARQNVGMMSVFTRTGGIVMLGITMGGGYAFARNASANLRRKNDSYNEAIGGFVAGGMVGIRSRSLPALVAWGGSAAIILAAFDYTGAKLAGYTTDPSVDEFERKQAIRTNRRRPIEETIAELGEGRGIYGPGYAERRRERIKKAYGIDVGATRSEASAV